MAGALDLVFACTFWGLKAGVSPVRILQSVAAGLLGKASFTGGANTAALGLALHFLIVLMMAGAYYMVARQWSLLWQRPWLCGAIYGLGLFAAMNHVVLPLSAAGPGPKDLLWIALSIAAHVRLIGIPIAWSTRWASAHSLPS